MHSKYLHPIIAREGWPFLAVTVVIAAGATWFISWWSLPFWLIAVFVLQFFRDPSRQVPADANAVCSPADGRIVAVEITEDPFAGGRISEDQHIHERV